MTKPLILASASPRRRELLAGLGVQFTVQPADIDESVQAAETPEKYVRRMASSKAKVGYNVAASADVTVLGCDTCVVVDERILGKPANEADALEMLELLSGRRHWVLSAVTMQQSAQRLEKLSATEVCFREIDASERLAYWQTGEPADKAGAYAIQGLGALFVKEIKGSYSGVVGLPLYETAQLLRSAGYSLLGYAS